MPEVKFTLDPNSPPRLSPEYYARLDAMTDEEIVAAAENDPDNPPMTEKQLERMDRSRHLQRARRAAGLSQPAFARAYRISLGRVRDLEQGRSAPDSAMVAYLALIMADPEGVRRTLEMSLAPPPADAA